MSGMILPFKNHLPRIGERAFIAPNAVVIGDVEIGAGASIWFGCTLRGDVDSIRVGARTNIQDNSVLHVTGGQFSTTVGANVLVGHGCIIHGCTLQDGCFVGMGTTILDGAVVESRAMVAAGSLVTPGKVVKAGELWGGRPAKMLRLLSEEEIAGFAVAVTHYADLAQVYRGNA